MTKNNKNPNSSHDSKTGYVFKDFIPLILIFLIIAILTILRSYISHVWNSQELMMNAMGAFFIIFGSFKIMKLTQFAEAYAMYDIIAKHSHAYALAYPFIELTLGILYFMHIGAPAINIITLILMVISNIGVANKLWQREQIMCACLGTVFKIPMTYVTLLEDVVMAIMALTLLL